MGLDDIKKRAQEQVAAADRRLKAAAILEGMNLTSDPAGCDYITFWVQEVITPTHDNVAAVHAVRVTKDGEWLWQMAKRPYMGSWINLIDTVFAGSCYPIAIRKPETTTVHDLFDAQFDPRSLDIR